MILIETFVADYAMSRTVSVKKHVVSFGDRKTDFATVSECESPSHMWSWSPVSQSLLLLSDFRTKFDNIRKTHTVNPKRDIFIHLTSMTVSSAEPHSCCFVY